MDEVTECEARIAFSRKKPHIHLHVSLKGDPGYERIHKISSTIEREVRKIVPNARVSIRSHPDGGGRGEAERIWELVRRIAEDEPGSRGAHNIHLQNLGGKVGVDFHLEVGAGMTIAQAHQVASRIESKLGAANAKISQVVIHVEKVSDLMSSEREGHGTEVRWYVEHVAKKFPEIRLVRPPTIRKVGPDYHFQVIIHAAFSLGLSLETAGQITSKLDAAIKQGYPAIVKVDIAMEPVEEGPSTPSLNPTHV